MIKLARNGSFEYIKEASWKKITAKYLKEKDICLYRTPHYYRVVVRIEWDDVYYLDEKAFPWVCSKSHFCRMCPTIITKEELQFLG